MQAGISESFETSGCLNVITKPTNHLVRREKKREKERKNKGQCSSIMLSALWLARTSNQHSQVWRNTKWTTSNCGRCHSIFQDETLKIVPLIIHVHATCLLLLDAHTCSRNLGNIRNVKAYWPRLLFVTTKHSNALRMDCYVLWFQRQPGLKLFHILQNLQNASVGKLQHA